MGETARKFKTPIGFICLKGPRKCQRFKTEEFFHDSTSSQQSWERESSDIPASLGNILTRRSKLTNKRRVLTTEERWWLWWPNRLRGNHMKSNGVSAGEGERETGFSYAPVAQASQSALVLPSAFQSSFPHMPRRNEGLCNDFTLGQK